MNRSVLRRILSIILLTLTVISSAFTPYVLAEEADRNDNPETENTDDTVIEYVVFVKDSGSDTNDGTEPANAFATLAKAYSALEETGGTVVICGKLTIYDESATLPEHTKDITLTSVYEGVDYRGKDEAEISYKHTLNIIGPGKTYLTGIRLHSETQANIFCNGSNVEFGTRVDNISDDGSYPSLWGGRMMTSSNVITDGHFSDFTLVVDSGYWHHVTLGNYRTNKYAPLSVIKNATLIINGGTYLAEDSEQYLSSLVSGADITGTLDLEINGGIFYGSFYIIGDEGPASPYLNFKYTADITVTISNGFFMGEYIKALYNPRATLYGTFNFSILSGSFSSLTYIGCEGVYSDITLTSCDAVQSKLYGFEKTVYVDAINGNDKNSGENPSSPKKTLSNAITSLIHGGTVVLCTEYSLPDGFIMTYNDSPIKITSVDHETDFGAVNSARLVAEGDINIQSGIIFESIKIHTPSSATLLCAGDIISVNANTVIDGEINIHLLENTKAHKLSIHSGDFAHVQLGSSDALTMFTMTGGSISKLSSLSEQFMGDVFFDLSGGRIAGDYTLSAHSVAGNVQLIAGNISLSGLITVPAPADGYVCEALVLNDTLSAKLVGFALVTDKYVFVKDGGTGDGSTPYLAAPDTDAALALIGENNASVIICGKYTHTLPKTDVKTGVNTYTSVYRGIDFAEVNNASVTLNSDFYFYNDSTIRDITVITNKPEMGFRCDSHIIIFGYGINCTPRYHTNSYYPSIYASEVIPSYPYNAKGESVSDKITVMGGSWNNIYGSAATHINGSVIYGRLFGTEDLSVNCTISITNGLIYGGVYAARGMKANSESSILITFTGGMIYGTVSPSYLASEGFKGKYTINITDGDFSGVEEFVDASFVGGNRSYINIDTNYDMEKGCDSLSTYSNPISSGMSTLQYVEGYWYLFEANSDKIIVRRSTSIPGLYSHEPYTTVETGSTIFDMSVSAVGGKIYIFIHNVFNQTHRTRVYASKTTDSGVVFEFYSEIERENILSPSLFVYDNQTYMYFSAESDEGTYDIYCAKLKDKLQFGTEPIKVLSATEKWEQSTLSTPRILKNPNGVYYLVYTGGDMYKDRSMIGLAIINDTSDLINSASYTKDKDPMIYTNSDHSKLIISSFINIDGVEPYFTFNTDYNGEILLMMQSYSFDNEGKPYFGEPSDANMLYLSHSSDKKLQEMIGGFEVNKSDDIDTKGQIKDFKLKTEHLIIVGCGLGLIVIVVAVVLIKKFITGQNTAVRKVPKVNSKKLQKDQKRRRSGKLYATYLEQVEKKNAEQDPSEEAIEEGKDDSEPFTVVTEEDPTVCESDTADERVNDNDKQDDGSVEPESDAKKEETKEEQEV